MIEGVRPEIDSGRFPIKRTVGEKVVVEADIFADGHDAISCILKYRKEDDPNWREAPMEFLINDRWRSEFTVTETRRYRYTLEAFRLDPQKPYQVHDLLTGARYLWHGARNYVELDPQSCPAHIFRALRRTLTERDFDYFM